jgi:hypothetical protein
VGVGKSEMGVGVEPEQAVIRKMIARLRNDIFFTSLPILLVQNDDHLTWLLNIIGQSQNNKRVVCRLFRERRQHSKVPVKLATQ